MNHLQHLDFMAIHYATTAEDHRRRTSLRDIGPADLRYHQALSEANQRLADATRRLRRLAPAGDGMSGCLSYRATREGRDVLVAWLAEEAEVEAKGTSGEASCTPSRSSVEHRRSVTAASRPVG